MCNVDIRWLTLTALATGYPCFKYLYLCGGIHSCLLCQSQGTNVTPARVLSFFPFFFDAAFLARWERRACRSAKWGTRTRKKEKKKKRKEKKTHARTRHDSARHHNVAAWAVVYRWHRSDITTPCENGAAKGVLRPDAEGGCRKTFKQSHPKRLSINPSTGPDSAGKGLHHHR